MKITEIDYVEMLRENRKLGQTLGSDPCRIQLLTNIAIHQLHDFLEFALRSESVPAEVSSANFDNIVQDSEIAADSRFVLIFWEIWRLTNGLFYKIDEMSERDFHSLIENTKSQIGLVLKNLQKVPLVLFNQFTALPFASQQIECTRLEKIAAELNAFVEQHKPVNTKIINTEKILIRLGIEKCFDWRNFYAASAPYSLDFFRHYVWFILPILLAAEGKSKKALIFDCDNTLWKNILGEDGFDNIKMSPETFDGRPFHEVQHLAVALAQKGILIGLCSKNNPEDVDRVLKSHPDMVLKDEHLAIQKVNWNDKAANLRQIADELNLSPDSLVFVDDSAFEIGLVNQQLPEVTTLLVPPNLTRYPQQIREISRLFYQPAVTDEDRQKVRIYQQQAQREQARQEFSNVEEYLRSLELKLKILKNDKNIVPRLAQLTQKTNQFNLTTRRYTENDIADFLNRKDYQIYAFSVADKFGDNGITGLAILKLNHEAASAQIDTFLISCRIIGRNIEFVFMDFLVKKMRRQGFHKFEAEYIQTPKNQQAADFYHRCSFSRIDKKNDSALYELKLETYQSQNIDYIQVLNGENGDGR